MGHGDSDGNFENATLETRLSDIQCAIDYLKKRSELKRIGMLGVRFGATLASLACQNISEIDSLILISPIIDGEAYIHQCLRSNLTTQMATYKKILKDRKALISDLMAGHTVNIDGYLLTKTLYQQIEAVNLLTNVPISPQNVLLLQVSRGENPPIEEGMKSLYTQYKAKAEKVELVNVKGDFFWTETKTYNPQAEVIQEAVINWLFKTYSA